MAKGMEKNGLTDVGESEVKVNEGMQRVMGGREDESKGMDEERAIRLGLRNSTANQVALS